MSEHCEQARESLSPSHTSTFSNQPRAWSGWAEISSPCTPIIVEKTLLSPASATGYAPEVDNYSNRCRAPSPWKKGSIFSFLATSSVGRLDFPGPSRRGSGVLIDRGEPARDVVFRPIPSPSTNGENRPSRSRQFPALSEKRFFSISVSSFGKGVFVERMSNYRHYRSHHCSDRRSRRKLKNPEAS